MRTIAEINTAESTSDDAGKISAAERRNTLAASYAAAFLTLGLLLRYCSVGTTLGVMLAVNVIVVGITLRAVREANAEAKSLAWIFLGCFNFLVLVCLSCPLCLR